MTIETRSTIELKDISAVEFGCPSCGAVIIRKIDQNFRMPSGCFNCDAQWTVTMSPEQQALTQLFRTLAHYSSVKFPFRCRLEIDGIKPPAL